MYELPDGSQIVRKASKPSDSPGPWALETLRREILYFSELPPKVAALFPPLLSAWGQADDTESVGYEIPYYGEHISVAERIARDSPSAVEAEAFQEALASMIFEQLHEPMEPTESMASHLKDTIHTAIEELAKVEKFRQIVEGRSLCINEISMTGLRQQWATVSAGPLLEALDREASVRLHGDLILENVLCSAHEDAWWTDLRLIDPVSVAGIAAGPALFDLVKYESYASGELLAIRSETCQAGHDSEDRYQFTWDHSPLLIQPYAAKRWHQTFRKQHGPVTPGLYHLLDAYFSLVMAVNTSGTQQWARVLKACLALQASLNVPK